MAELNIYEDKLELKCRFDEKDIAKSISGRQWDKVRKTWQYPINKDILSELKKYFPNIYTEPIVIEKINQILEKENKLLHLKSLTDYPDLIIPNCKIIPYKHQKVGIAFLSEAQNALLADELGAGKTLTAIINAIILKDKNLINKCLIACPSSTKYLVWSNEIEKFTYEKSIVINGNSKKRKELYLEYFNNKDIFFLIANYEILRIDLIESYKCVSCGNIIKDYGKPKKCNKCKSNNFINSGDLKLLNKLEQQKLMIISDECIKIKSRKSLQTQAIKSIPALYKIGISGYPVANKLIDIWSQIDWLYPGLLGTYWSFEDKYLVKNCFNAVTGYKNIEKLKKKIEPYYIRRLKKDVLDLPPFTNVDRDVELVGDQLKAYNQMKKDLYVLLDNMTEEEFKLEANSILSQMIRLSQISSGYMTNLLQKDKPIWFKNPAKFEVLNEIIEEVLANEKKIVVWSRFVAVTRKTKEIYGDICEYIDGSVPSENRADIIKEFTEETNLKILSCQMQTCGMGVNLTAANTEVFMDLAFISPSDYIQSTERLIRPGQIDKVTIINLIAKNTIDEHWAKLLKDKQEIANQLITKCDAINKEMLVGMLK